MAALQIISKSILLVGIGAAAFSDVKRRTVPIFLIIVLFLGGLMTVIVCTVLRTDAGDDIYIWQRLISCIPGICMVLISFLSKGAIGLGDALFFAAIGIFFDPLDMIFFMLLSFAAAALFGIILLISLRRRFKDTLPFMPFILIGYICFLLLNMNAG